MTAAEFRTWYESRGLSQPEMAERLGLPNPREGGKVSVSRWSTGARPVPRAIAALVRALETLESREAGAEVGRPKR